MEHAAAPREAAAEWPDRYDSLCAYAFHLGDPELRAQVLDLLAVANRDRLEQPECFAAEDLAAVERNYRDLIDRYQRGVRRAEEACRDDATGFGDQLNALGAGLLKRLEELFARRAGGEA